MTKDQQQTLLTAKFSDLPKLFPDYPMDELRKRRKNLQTRENNIRNRCFRDRPRPDRDDAWMNEAREGSARLLDAIRRAQ